MIPLGFIRRQSLNLLPGFICCLLIGPEIPCVRGLLAQCPVAEKTDLVGHPLPDLALSESVRGAWWSTDQLSGAIAIIEIFQSDSTYMYSGALSLGQTLCLNHLGDLRLRVVGVLAAWPGNPAEKEAEHTKLAAALREKRIVYPIMRAREPGSVRQFLGEPVPGNPASSDSLTLIVDSEGIVRWQGLNASLESHPEIEKFLDHMLECFYVEPLPELRSELGPCVELYRKQLYGQASVTAQAIVSDGAFPEEVRRQAQLVMDNIDAGVKKLIQASAEQNSRGYPHRSQRKLEEAMNVFRGVAAVAEAARQLRERGKDENFVRDLSVEKSLEKIQVAGSDASIDRGFLQRELSKLEENSRNAPLTDRIRRAKISLQH